jgi:lipoate-protein ligase A
VWTTPRLIINPPAPGAWNMAVDEALLIDAAESDIATLRFYEWDEPTLSLGYFQAYGDRDGHTASRQCPCVRRQTGGGAIVHDREITYSLILPPSHPYARRTTELYALVHDAFIATLTNAISGDGRRIVLQRLQEMSKPRSDAEPFLCFERRAIGDVVAMPWQTFDDGVAWNANEAKILGSAQRRSRGAILQHGSLLLQKSAAAPELAGLQDINGAEAPSIRPAQLVDHLETALEMRFEPEILARRVELNAGHLANSKYKAAAWTKRR